MKMIPNCILEARGFVEKQDERGLYLNERMMELAGDKLETMTSLTCSTCELWHDCKPRPLFEKGEFVGVRIEV